MGGQKALRFNQKYLNLCSEDERRSYGFGTTWGWVIDDIIVIFGWTNPLIVRVIHHLCASLSGGYTRLQGGRWSDSRALSCVERFDSFGQYWTTVSSLHQARSGLGVTVLEGMIYVVGGKCAVFVCVFSLVLHVSILGPMLHLGWPPYKIWFFKGNICTCSNISIQHLYLRRWI